MKKVGKVDLHLNLEKDAFFVMEKLRQKKSRTAFVEELIKERERDEHIVSLIEKVKANQRKLFAILVLVASKLGIGQSEIQKAIEIKNKEVK